MVQFLLLDFFQDLVESAEAPGHSLVIVFAAINLDELFWVFVSTISSR